MRDSEIEASPRADRLGAVARAGVVALCLAAGACAHYRPEPISPASTLGAFDQRSLSSPELREFARRLRENDAWPPSAWDLDALTLVAFFFSPELDLARARWELARAGRVTAGERPNPMLEAREGYNAAAGEETPWIPEVALGLPIETAGKRGIRLAEARSRFEAARLELFSTAWSVRSRLRAASVELFVAQRAEALLASRSELLGEIADRLERQLRLGAVSANEAAQARIASERERLSSLEAAQRTAEARVELAAALGLPAAALDGAPLAFDRLEDVDPAALSNGLDSLLSSNQARRRAVTGRADVLASLASYEAAQSSLQLEIARQYPDLDIGLGYQLDQTDGKWTLGLGLVLPAFSRNRGPIAEAEARRAEAAAELLRLQARVIAEVDGARAALSSALERDVAAGRLVDRQREREAAMRRIHALGESSELELLSARLELSDSEQSQLDALEQVQRAVGRLESAMQSTLTLDRAVLESPERAPEQKEDADG